ncbi:MAG: thiol peroxidase [Propionicimonas sp.]|uniref:thiol peroxidase n=1 Tax=Propionicimonas sp. TaxID=1955623 RepID=UPI003D0D3FA5
MATLEQRGTTVHSVGDLPAVGTALPDFTLTGSDMEDTVTPAVAAGRRLVLNIFPSIDTATCAMSVRKFNELAAGLDNTLVLCVSNDLPAAQARFCGAEGIENVVTASGFRSSFGDDYGVTLVDGRSRGLLSRAVVVADTDGTILYTQQVPVISSEPDYDAALAALA